MAYFTQILVAFVVIQWSEEVTSAPLLQGVKLTRSFDIDFKPFQFKPFAYIREKWGPFGAFGKKHIISKRATLDSFVTQPPPLVPAVSIVSSMMNTGISVPPPIGPAFGSPAPVFEPRMDNPPPPVNISPLPMSSTMQPPLSNDIFPQGIPRSSPFPPNMRPIFNGLGQLGLTGLNTDISRFQPSLQNVNPTPIFDNGPLRVNLLVPPTAPPNGPAPVDPSGPEVPPLARGGTIARFFGEFFLQLLSRLFNNARSSFSQLSPSQ